MPGASILWTMRSSARKPYLEAGADWIFPEALADRNEFERFADEIDCPLVANMTEFGKSPLLSLEELADLGYAVVLYPVTLLRVAMKAVEAALAVIADEGSQTSLLDLMQTRQESVRFVGILRLRTTRSALLQRQWRRAANRRQRAAMSENLYRPGLEGIIAGESAICSLTDGLAYRGYAIGELAAQASFDEVAFLLLHGELPKSRPIVGISPAIGREYHGSASTGRFSAPDSPTTSA